MKCITIDFLYNAILNESIFNELFEWILDGSGLFFIPKKDAKGKFIATHYRSHFILACSPLRINEWKALQQFVPENDCKDNSNIGSYKNMMIGTHPTYKYDEFKFQYLEQEKDGQ